jgi:hypothetical protein
MTTHQEQNPTPKMVWDDQKKNQVARLHFLCFYFYTLFLALYLNIRFLLTQIKILKLCWKIRKARTVTPSIVFNRSGLLIWNPFSFKYSLNFL